MFRVHKLRDCADEAARGGADPDGDAELAGMVAERGPDEFTLSLVGPEMHSLLPQMRHRGACR